MNRAFLSFAALYSGLTILVAVHDIVAALWWIGSPVAIIICIWLVDRYIADR